jgi:cytochrome c
MKHLLITSLLLGSSVAMADGKRVLESQCMECHMVDGQGGVEKAAPPMYAVWHHYRQVHPEKDAFVAALSGWLQQPDPSKSQMKGAIKRFGVMDRLDISESDALSVAEYLYDRQFDLPDWYVTHYNNKHGKKEHGYDGTEKATQKLER